jgi:RNA polymerase subunit RPABC4/transcription elongation factor Spt4
MAEKMIVCKACGKEIAKSAKTCPHCGKKNKRPFWQIMLILIGIIIVIAVASGLGGGSDKSAEAQKVEANEIPPKNTESTGSQKVEAIEISPDELYTIYEENEVKADNLYKGKTVRITGIINDIGTDVLDEPYITFAGDEYGFTGIQIYFNKAERGKIADVSKGRTVTIVGKCDGKLINVFIRNSVFE